MKKSKQQQVPSQEHEPIDSTEFFETMPISISDAPWRADHFVYRDDAVIDHHDEKYDNPGKNIESEIKTTAIITLVLVLITAVALSLFIWRGLTTVKGNINQLTDTTSYEL